MSRPIDSSYCRKYLIYFLVAFFILLIQFLLALSFYSSNNVENQFTNQKFKKKIDDRKKLVDTFTKEYDNDDDGSNSLSNILDKNLRTKYLSQSNYLSTSLSSKLLDNKKDLSDSLYTLNLLTLDFKPNCDLTVRDAIYAINRANSQQCKHEIANITCLIQSDNLFAEKLPTYCPVENPKKRNAILPKFSNNTPKSHIKIAFLLTLNGRALRQVTRLLRHIYSRQHYYFIHVDKRQDYMYNELLKYESLPNIQLSKRRLSTIWGGVSLLQMTLNSLRSLLKIPDWDYFINLSESDFPIKSLNHLEYFLELNNGSNFVKSHGQEKQRFLTKQGLDKVFHECEHHMWRLSDRNLPKGVNFDGGSDWFALTREFSSYIIESKNEFLEGLNKFFMYTLLPAETYFHTVIKNSKLCETVIDNNLHITNWRRKQGCRCQHKNIVDWCGCSPNVFKLNDWSKILDTEQKALFFGRKFEPVVSQAIINKIEKWISKTENNQLISLEKYWQSDWEEGEKSYSEVNDGKKSFYVTLASLINKKLTCFRGKLKLSRSTLYFENDIYKGTLIEINNNASFEALTRPQNHVKIFKVISSTERLIDIQVCSDYDVKEQMFRNFGCILNPFSELIARHHWLSENNFTATFVWIDPSDSVTGSYGIKIESGRGKPLWFYHKPNFNQPLRPGIWRLIVLYNWNQIGETKFLIMPLLFHGGKKLEANVKYFNDGPFLSRYTDHNFTSIENLLGLNKSRNEKLMIAKINGKRYGPDLVKWAEDLVSNFWSIHNICQKNATCKSMVLCNETYWSSLSPDPKSELIGTLNSISSQS